MKTKILALLVVAMITFNFSYASNIDNNVTEIVLTSFSQQFDKASDVQWVKTADFYKATFVWNDQYLTAFYDEKGESISIARNIVQKDLPLVLQTIISSDYKNYWVSDLFEYTTKDSDKFYVTVESADKKIILESVDNNYWEVFKKSSKE